MGAEIEVSPEMIAAGLRAYSEWDSRFEEPEGLVVSILEEALAILAANPKSCAPLSPTARSQT